MPALENSEDVEAVEAGGILELRLRTSAARLKEWTDGEDYEATSITRDADGVVTTATVKWPDGSGGTFTTTSQNATWLAVDAFTISHTNSGLTVTQAAVTRGSDGQITDKPALTVA